jgi:Ca2+/Na+ antiporter
MIISVLWLAFLAEFMMNSAETMGCILEIEEDVMGLTLTAAGTSLPNLFASIIVAKQGLGNMSVSNAFGSNTFNIFIALALPWFIGSIIHGQVAGTDCNAFSILGSCCKPLSQSTSCLWIELFF